MNRKAFTLIELVVSIALFGLITIFLFGTIDELRKQQTFYQKKEEIIVRKNMILSLLRADLYRPQSLLTVNTQNKDFDILSITASSRSLYGIDRPYVIWMVLKNENRLIRLESAVPISIPLPLESLYLTHSDTIATECEIFRIYDSPKHRLAFLKLENQSPLIVEAVK